jgi:hypothetical protein
LGRIALLAVASLTLSALSACSVFDTREADAPGGEGTTWQVPSVPSRVFINLRTGLEELNGVNYVRSIGDVFTFVPLPVDEGAQDLQGKFVDWTKAVEEDVVNRLVAESAELTVSFDFTQIRDENPFADFDVDYILMQRLLTAPQDTIQYRGKARLEMRDGSGGWQIIKWTDIEEVEGFETWGRKRGELRQLQ